MERIVRNLDLNDAVLDLAHRFFCVYRDIRNKVNNMPAREAQCLILVSALHSLHGIGIAGKEESWSRSQEDPREGLLVHVSQVRHCVFHKDRSEQPQLRWGREEGEGAQEDACTSPPLQEAGVEGRAGHAKVDAREEALMRVPVGDALCLIVILHSLFRKTFVFRC